MKRIYYYLAILNFADGILTYIGLELNLIEEANIAMRLIYEAHPISFLIVKSLLSLLLCTLCFYQKIPNHKFMKTITFVGATLYTMVMFIHAYWVIEII